MPLLDAELIGAVKREFQGKYVRKITEGEIGTIRDVTYRNGKFTLTVEYSSGNRIVSQEQFGYYGIVTIEQAIEQAIEQSIRSKLR